METREADTVTRFHTCSCVWTSFYMFARSVYIAYLFAKVAPVIIVDDISLLFVKKS